MDSVALWVGYAVMAAGGGLLALALLLAAWFAAGLIGVELFKRIRRIYSLKVVWHWLDKLEREGLACFEKAQAGGSSKHVDHRRGDAP